MDRYWNEFRRGLEDFHISLSAVQLEQFHDFYLLLMEKNKIMNLTAITDFEDVVKKHFLDSLSLCKVYDLSSDDTLLDLGTGAGFPGIPLKIAYPSLNLVLLDSLNKRVHFLEEVISSLGLCRIEAIHGRAEDLGRDFGYREHFDLCVSRAVASLNTLVEYCIPFVKVGGKFISYKSGDPIDEVKVAKTAVAVLGGKVEDVYQFDLFGQGRSFVIISKDRKTPLSYPRRAGMPSKSPLS